MNGEWAEPKSQINCGWTAKRWAEIWRSTEGEKIPPWSDADFDGYRLDRQGWKDDDRHRGNGGKAVHYCIEQGKVLQQLTLEELQAMSPLFAEDIHHFLDIETCVDQRNTYNGTSPASVQRQCGKGHDTIAAEQQQIEQWDTTVSAVYTLLQ